LAQSRTGPFAEAVVHAPRVVTGNRHAPQSLRSVLSQMQRPEATREALANRTPCHVVR
jgi:hypothetical protein